MARNILESIGKKFRQFFIGPIRSSHSDASSRQDIRSLAIGLLDSSISLLSLTLPLFTGIALVQNDIGDAIEQVFSKIFSNTLNINVYANHSVNYNH